MNTLCHRPRPTPLTLALLLTGILTGCATPEQEPMTLARALLIERTAMARTAVQPAPTASEAPHTSPQRITASAVRARRQSQETLPNKSHGNTVTLNFDNTDIHAVVATLARFTGRSFIVDPRIKGDLTLVSEAPVSSDAAYAMLLSALRMQGFAVIDVDGVSRVVPEADAKLQPSPVISPTDGGTGYGARGGEIVTRVFPVRYENAEALVAVLRPLIAPNNTINAFAGNNTLVVTDYADNLERIAALIASLDTPTALASDYVPIRHGVALDVAAIAAQLLDAQARDDNERVTVVADPRSNALLVTARSPERLDLARQLIARIDAPQTRPANLHVVNLRNAQATQLADVLRGALSGQTGGGADTGGGALSPLSATPLSQTTEPIGAASTNAISNTQTQRSVSFSAGGATIQADPTTNTLIISAPPPLYRSLREVIDLLDQRRAQVLVEALIVEVNAENAAELGIQWMAGGDRIAAGGTTVIGGANFGGSGMTANGTSTIDALGQGFSLGLVRGTTNILGNPVINLGVLARAMRRVGGTNVLSTPNLMTLDNEEASIVVGRRVPFITGRYTTSGDGSSNPFQTVEREDVGLTLRIRPQISEGGTVKLALYQEVSSIDPVASQTATTLVTRKRALETNVLVDDGQIIVLGGLLEDSVDHGTASVPGLGQIPLLGRLFRYDNSSRSQTNLMVFLRPHIVRTSGDAASLTLDRYNYMRASQTRLPQDTMNQLLPKVSRLPLPVLQQDAETGLLDLRAPQTEDDAVPTDKDSPAP